MRVSSDDIGRGGAPRRGAAILAGAAIAWALVSGAATAQVGGGGVAPPGDPEITDVRCVTKCIKARVGVIGSKFRIIGSELSQVRVVSLPRADGRRAKDFRPRVRVDGSVVARARKGARTGPVRVFTSFSQVESSPIDFKIGTKAQLKKVQAQYRFPIRAPHSYGDGLGAGRGHQGQDIFAKCGAPIVAAHTGRVVARSGRGPSGAAGHYVTIYDKKTNRSHSYLHLLKPTPVKRKQLVSTGQLIGKVGQSGNARGCHLHFELRKGKGWFGKVLNPTPTLRSWDSYS